MNVPGSTTEDAALADFEHSQLLSNPRPTDPEAGSCFPNGGGVDDKLSATGSLGADRCRGRVRVSDLGFVCHGVPLCNDG